ncbi:hypothetical protein HAX54_017499 [Datura stramonium]|uniref:Uncharacterized protein n=1 Tax=Datura stramonium TaxID=4076 RepID=A0ABS8S0F3_DATST|nr:hypothetical protein [Datura stramonium]
MEPKGFWQGSTIIWEGKVSKVSSDATIASYGEEGSWNFTFRRNINVREIGKVASSLNPSKVLIAMRTPWFGSHGAKDQVHRKYNLSRHLCYISRGVGELHFPRSQS